jgi:hypothetical protein
MQRQVAGAWANLLSRGPKTVQRSAGAQVCRGELIGGNLGGQGHAAKAGDEQVQRQNSSKTVHGGWSAGIRRKGIGEHRKFTPKLQEATVEAKMWWSGRSTVVCGATRAAVVARACVARVEGKGSICGREEAL